MVLTIKIKKVSDGKIDLAPFRMDFQPLISFLSTG